MKKVLVLLVAAALLASPAFGAVRNSKHDLSASSTASVRAGATSVDEVCVFCHTPHGGVTGILAPLWNRSIPGGGLTSTQLYNSATLDTTNSRPSVVVSAVNTSDAPLCLSCHDGGSLASGLVNPPNAGGQPTGGTLANGTQGFANITGGGSGDGSMLTNDHPIGMNYSGVVANDGTGFNASSGAFPNEAVGNLPLYTSNGVMWCSTCHDVHDEGNGTPLLVESNAGSAMCTTCHVK